MLKWTTVIALAALLSGPGCDQGEEIPLPRTPATDVSRASFDLLEAHNRLRKDRGLPPLERNEALQRAAEAHAEDMARNTFMSHTGSDGSSPFKRIDRMGYKWTAAGENVAAGQQTVDAVMKTWLGDLGHRRNIMGGYKHLGAAVRLSRGGYPYWVVDFGRPE